MKDDTVSVIFQTDSEVEANIYAALLSEADIPVQVRLLEDPITTNIIRQIAFASYQVVVPKQCKAKAEEIVATQQQLASEVLPDGEETSQLQYENRAKHATLLLGRILIWILIFGLLAVGIHLLIGSQGISLIDYIPRTPDHR